MLREYEWRVRGQLVGRGDESIFEVGALLGGLIEETLAGRPNCVLIEAPSLALRAGLELADRGTVPSVSDKPFWTLQRIQDVTRDT